MKATAKQDKVITIESPLTNIQNGSLLSDTYFITLFGRNGLYRNGSEP